MNEMTERLNANRRLAFADGGAPNGYRFDMIDNRTPGGGVNIKGPKEVESVGSIGGAARVVSDGAGMRIPKAAELKNSNAVQSHIDDFVKHGEYKGEAARPFIDANGTNTLVDEIIQGGPPMKDVYLPNGLRWDVPGNFRGVDGTWELVVDLNNNTIVHFNFITN
jgi:hypothetical protein